MRVCHDVYENKKTYASYATMLMIKNNLAKITGGRKARNERRDTPRVLPCHCPIVRELGLGDRSPRRIARVPMKLRAK